MGRKSSVTFEMVSAAFDGLVASGVVRPSAKAVRDYLSSKALPGAEIGSLGTFQKHLDAISDRKISGDGVQLGKPVLPDDLTQAAVRAIVSAGKSARDEVRAEIDAQKLQIQELNDESVRYEQEFDRLNDELELCTNQKNVAETLVVSMTSDLSDIKRQAQLDSKAQILLQEACGELSVKNALLDQMIKVVEEREVQSNKRSDDQKDEFASLEQKLIDAMEIVRANEATERAAKFSAEKNVDLLKAKVDALEVNLAAESARNLQLMCLVKSQEDLGVQYAASDATNRELRVQIDMLKNELLRNHKLEQIFQNLPVDSVGNRNYT